MRFSLHVSLLLTLLLLFSGCTKTNAFSRFHFDLKKEYATSSLRSSKINFNYDVLGVVSSIYLNEVSPKQYKGMEYFLIAVYTKDNDTLDDPNSDTRGKLVIKLNELSPIKIKKLDHDNEFERLMAQDNNWTSYYLVAFNTSESDRLSLTLQDGKFGSLPLVYQKNEQ
jgi:hypothetical protein